MRPLIVSAVVEGEGEVQALPKLLFELAAHIGIPAIRLAKPPIRQKRDQLLKENHDSLYKSLQLARHNVVSCKHEFESHANLVLLIIDSERECTPAAPLGVALQARIDGLDLDVSSKCVVADSMYESWIIAGIDSETTGIAPGAAEEIPTEDTEACKLGKGWLKTNIDSPSYRETTDQKILTSAMNLELALSRSASLRKLERVLRQAATTEPEA